MIRDVHTQHCCKFHGCKYGEEDCPVTTGQKSQQFPCEFCLDDHEPIVVQFVHVWQAMQTAIGVDLEAQGVKPYTPEWYARLDQEWDRRVFDRTEPEVGSAQWWKAHANEARERWCNANT